MALAALGGLALLPAAAASAAPAVPAVRADVDDFRFASMDVVYRLSRDADGSAALEVEERIVAVFPDFDQNKGFYRDIPEYSGDSEHGWVRLETRLIDVTDESGAPVPHWTEYYEDFYSIGLGDDDYVHGETAYVIRYTQRHVVRGFPAEGDAPAVDELYWDVNGTGWAQPFGRVSAELRVAPELVPALTGPGACYEGWYGEAGDCALERTDDLATGEAVLRAAAGPFEPEESLTIAVGFEPGTFVPGPSAEPPSQSYGDDWDYEPKPPLPAWLSTALLGVGPLGLLLGVVARFTGGKARWRQHPASDIVVPQYTAPEADLMIAAHVAGQPDRAFAAQLVDLAVTRRLRILDDDPEGGGADFRVELVDAAGLEGRKRQFVDALFGTGAAPGERVTVRGGNQRFAKDYDRLRKGVEAALVTEGYVTPSRITKPSLALMIGGIGSAVLAWSAHGYADIVHGAGIGFLPALMSSWGGWQTMTRSSTTRDLTDRGKRLNDHLLGMRDYLELAEKDRFAVLQSVAGAERVRVDPGDPAALVRLYERLLPWAVMWGVERSWGEVLVAAAEEARVELDWVGSSERLSSWRLYRTMSLIDRAAPAVPVPPKPTISYSGGGGWSSSGSSSFSSGSSGGGFSGGGGGGGGGRGR